MFASSDVVVRRFALQHLARFGPEAIPTLTAALEDPRGEIVAGAAQTLGQMGRRAQSAVPALTKALNNPDVGARAQAVEALELVGGTDAIPALREVSNDPDPIVSGRARGALSRLEQQTK